MPCLKAGKALAEALGVQLRLPQRKVAALRKRGKVRNDLTAAQCVCTGEYPGIAEAAPADHGKLALCVAEDMLRILRGKDVAVCDDRNVHRTAYLTDDVPIRTPGVHLRPRSAVDGDRRGTRLLRHACEFDGVYAAAVEALAKLHGHGDGDRPDDAFDDAPRKLGVTHERRAVAAFDDLSHGAAHVYVENIRTAALERHGSRLRHDLRLVTEYLHCKRAGHGRIVQQGGGLLVTVNERLCAYHLGRHHRSAKLRTNETEGKVADSRHWRKGKAPFKLYAADVHHSISNPTGQWSEPVISGRMYASFMLPHSLSETRK